MAGFAAFSAVCEIFKDSVNLILQTVPAGIDIKEVEKYLPDIPGVEAVHDLHIWAINTTETALAARVVKPDVKNEDAMLIRIHAEIYDRFGTMHVTLQVERSKALIDCGNRCRVCKVKE